MSKNSDLKLGEKGAWISIGTYIFLSIFKLVFAHIGNSAALRADGLNNFTDVLASVAVLIGLRISQKPADENHRYGHSRAETIASLVAALIMISVGIQVVVGSVKSFINPVETKPEIMTAFVALFSALVMFFVYRYNLKLSKRISSKALYSAAQDNRSDALVSIGAAVGITGSFFGLTWLDPLTALIVGLIICYTAYEIFKDAVHDLTDGFQAEELNRIEATISTTPGVKFVKDIKARLSGNQPIVDATIIVDPSLSVTEGHEITKNVEQRLLDEHHIKYALIHIEPF